VVLKDLKERLGKTVWPHELEDVTDWSYGVPLRCVVRNITRS